MAEVRPAYAAPGRTQRRRRSRPGWRGRRPPRRRCSAQLRRTWHPFAPGGCARAPDAAHPAGDANRDLALHRAHASPMRQPSAGQLALQRARLDVRQRQERRPHPPPGRIAPRSRRSGASSPGSSAAAAGSCAPRSAASCCASSAAAPAWKSSYSLRIWRGVDVARRADAAGAARLEPGQQQGLGAGEDRELGKALDQQPGVVPVARAVLHAGQHVRIGGAQALDQPGRDRHAGQAREMVQVKPEVPAPTR